MTALLRRRKSKGEGRLKSYSTTSCWSYKTTVESQEGGRESRVWLWPWLITAAWLSSLFTRDQRMTRTSSNHFFPPTLDSAMLLFRQGHISVFVYANLFSVDHFIRLDLPGQMKSLLPIGNIFLFSLSFSWFSSYSATSRWMCEHGWNHVTNVAVEKKKILQNCHKLQPDEFTSGFIVTALTPLTKEWKVKRHITSNCHFIHCLSVCLGGSNNLLLHV